MSFPLKISLIFVILMLVRSFPSSSIPCPSSRPITCDTDEYIPVCAYRNLQCFAAPCNNYETITNACQACLDPTVLWYIKGECVCKPFRPSKRNA